MFAVLLKRISSIHRLASFCGIFASLSFILWFSVAFEMIIELNPTCVNILTVLCGVVFAVFDVFLGLQKFNFLGFSGVFVFMQCGIVAV
jgi:hypothetical protein